MQATIKIHSSLHKYFDQKELRADFNTYYDLVPYLSAMHPRFNHYMRMVNWGESEEGYAFLDKNFNVVSVEELHVKRVHEDDTIYLAPVIVGGGGKKGNILAAIAVVGIIAASGGTAAPALLGTGSGTAASLGFGGATGNLAASGALSAGTSAGGILSGFASMPAFAQSLFANIGMALLSSLFTKKKKPMETDTSTRQGGAFGSLTNSTQSGTPIALHYGLVRVAGQMLSGYIDSDDHGKNDVIKVEDKF